MLQPHRCEPEHAAQRTGHKKLTVALCASAASRSDLKTPKLRGEHVTEARERGCASRRRWRQSGPQQHPDRVQHVIGCGLFFSRLREPQRAHLGVLCLGSAAGLPACVITLLLCVAGVTLQLQENFIHRIKGSLTGAIVRDILRTWEVKLS